MLALCRLLGNTPNGLYVASQPVSVQMPQTVAGGAMEDLSSLKRT